MTEREKMISLLDHPLKAFRFDAWENSDRIADYILASGQVIVLPCKVGDTVYQYGWKYSECHLGFIPSFRPCPECEGCCAVECDSEKTAWLYSGRVVEIHIVGGNALVKIAWSDKWDTSSYIVGKNVFLTREEAEAALKEGQ